MEKYNTFIATLSLLAVVTAYPTGAPTGACKDMAPQHGTAPQASKMPYTVIASKNTAAPGDVVQLTLSSNGEKLYKGFFIQARIGDEIVGTFDVSDSDAEIQTLDCPNGKKNTITQKNSGDKKSITVDYVVPNVKGQIVFYATIVESYAVFWVKQPTATVNVN